METEATRPPWQRAYLLGCAAVIGWAVASCLGDFGRWSRLWYLPYERTWSLGSEPPPGVAMGLYGIMAWGASGAAVAMLAVAGVMRVWQRPVPATALRIVGAWALTAAALSGAYFVWHSWPF